MSVKTKPRRADGSLRQSFDLDGLMKMISRVARQTEKANAELEAWLDRLDPDWQERPSRNKKSGRKANIVVSNTIGDDVIAVLRAGELKGDRFYLPNKQLDRSLYVRVNDVLERIGGKWKGGKVKAHIFEDDPTGRLAEAIGTRLMPPKNPLGFFETPDAVIDLVLEKIVGIPKSILEPSAGRGAIVRYLRHKFPKATITAVELDELRAAFLGGLSLGIRVENKNFLSMTAGDFDCVVMNPPFATERDRLEYLEHYRVARDVLAAKGQLVGIAPAGLLFRNDKRTKLLREMIYLMGGTIEKLPPSSFSMSGTEVSVVLVYLRKS